MMMMMTMMVVVVVVLTLAHAEALFPYDEKGYSSKDKHPDTDCVDFRCVRCRNDVTAAV